ncbi:MAG: hypothetical protein GY740_09385, partial [Gammaproteobacteria bacterium]|nr:hypothetical protein [Gammaproteobacteria bacterium]
DDTLNNDYLNSVQQNLRSVYDTTSYNLKAAQAATKKYFDEHTKPSLFKEGDIVWFKSTRHRRGTLYKLKSIFQGPMKIVKLHHLTATLEYVHHPDWSMEKCHIDKLSMAFSSLASEVQDKATICALEEELDGADGYHSSIPEITPNSSFAAGDSGNPRVRKIQNFISAAGVLQALPSESRFLNCETKLAPPDPTGIAMRPADDLRRPTQAGSPGPLYSGAAEIEQARLYRPLLQPVPFQGGQGFQKEPPPDPGHYSDLAARIGPPTY